MLCYAMPCCVPQGAALFGGPAAGGYIAAVGSKRDAVWLSCIFCLMAAALCLLWTPPPVPDKQQESGQETHKKLDLALGPKDLPSPKGQPEEASFREDPATTPFGGGCVARCCWPLGMARHATRTTPCRVSASSMRRLSVTGAVLRQPLRPQDVPLPRVARP